jgi:hypothetical protein
MLQEKKFIVCNSGHGNIETINEVAFISMLPERSLRIFCITSKIWEGDRVQISIDNILPESNSISPRRQADCNTSVKNM